MNADKSIGQEFPGNGGDRLAKKKCGARQALEQNVIALGFDRYDFGGIDE